MVLLELPWQYRGSILAGFEGAKYGVPLKVEKKEDRWALKKEWSITTICAIQSNVYNMYDYANFLTMATVASEAEGQQEHMKVLAELSEVIIGTSFSVMSIWTAHS